MASCDEMSEPLLTKEVKYYENCPGCKVEERNEKQEARSLKELILLALVVLCNGNALNFFCFFFQITVFNL